MESLICTVVVREPSPSEVIRFQGDVIGVDYGAFYCARHGYPMKLAIGDFDSIDRANLPLIESFADEEVVLPEMKDVSDFEAALERLEGYEKIYVYGGLGGRLDHQFAMMKHLQRDSRLVFLNENNKIYVLKKGEHTLDKNGFKYLSLFAMSASLLSIEGVKYPLSNKVLDTEDTYTLSNEILSDSCTLNLMSGQLLIIQSNDKKS